MPQGSYCGLCSGVPNCLWAHLPWQGEMSYSYCLCPPCLGLGKQASSCPLPGPGGGEVGHRAFALDLRITKTTLPHTVPSVSVLGTSVLSALDLQKLVCSFYPKYELGQSNRVWQYISKSCPTQNKDNQHLSMQGEYSQKLFIAYQFKSTDNNIHVLFDIYIEKCVNCP